MGSIATQEVARMCLEKALHSGLFCNSETKFPVFLYEFLRFITFCILVGRLLLLFDIDIVSYHCFISNNQIIEVIVYLKYFKNLLSVAFML